MNGQLMHRYIMKHPISHKAFLLIFYLSSMQEQKKKGVIAASAGNHALALSYHGSDLGIPITVVMPMIAPLMKIQNCKTHGARVIMKGKNISEVGHVNLTGSLPVRYINQYELYADS